MQEYFYQYIHDQTALFINNPNDASVLKLRDVYLTDLLVIARKPQHEREGRYPTSEAQMGPSEECLPGFLASRIQKTDGLYYCAF